MTIDERIDQKFEEVGGFGIFQFLASIALIFGINSQAWWMYNLAYLIEPPTYLCLINGTWKSGDSCTIDDICQKKPYITDYKIDFDQGSGSLHNWWEKLDLLCMPEWQTHFMGTAFFVGWCSTLLWLPRLSDKHGRKMIFAYRMVA